MKIKILGTGCPNCKKLEQNTKDAISSLGQEIEIEKITGIEDIMKYNVMSMPALVIDETVAISGRVPSAEEIKKLLSKNEISSAKTTGCSSCGDKY